jgi:E3 Ubiquitin ligase
MILSTLLLRSSNPGAFVLWCVLGLCLGLYLFFQGFRLLQRRQLILNTPVSKIRSASMGMVELSGLAVGPYTMAAPVTSRPCYCYRTFVWEWKQAGRSKQWVKVAAECMHVPFFLDDNTGKVMVDPRGADLDLHQDFQQEFCDGFFTTKQEVPPKVRGFLSRHGINTTNKIKVEEFCIKPKNALFLLGTLDENPGLELTPQPIQDDETAAFIVGNALSFSLNPERARTVLSRVTGDGNLFSGVLTGGLQHDPAFDPIYNKAISTTSTRVIRLSPDPGPQKAADMTQQQKISAALMKAGVTNLGAWAAAGVITPGVAASQNPNDSSSSNNTQASAPNDFDPNPPVVLMKGKNNPTFLISWRSQRDLARSLGWKCAAMICGGPALALLSLYALLNLTHLF